MVASSTRGYAWIAYRTDGNTLILAGREPPDRRMIRQALDRYGQTIGSIDLVIATRSQLDRAVARARALPQWTALDSNQ